VKFANAGKIDLWTAIFGGRPRIFITRNRLLNFAFPTAEQKCAEILLWGYPTDGHGVVSQLLPVIGPMAAAAAVPGGLWTNYFTGLRIAANGARIGISTASKLAYFNNHVFGGFRALILDTRILDVSPFWVEVAIGITYNTAIPRYLDYLQAMNGLAGTIGCNEDQLEFWNSFYGH
jgi:hypothetical protein